jgi:hypothetical protein
MQVHQEKKTAKFRISFIFLFIIASFAACFALYMVNDSDITWFDSFGSSDDTIDVFAEETEDAAVSAAKAVINPVPACEAVDDSYFDDSVFIVSSCMSGLADYNIIPKENILSGDYLLSEIFLEAAVFLDGKSFESCYIMAGMNDLDDTGDGFDGLLQTAEFVLEANPDANVYIMSLPPIKASDETESATNVKISAFNSKLLKFANENGLHYVDINTSLVGNDGKLPDSAAEKGVSRLKRDTYLAIKEYLLTHIA